MCVYVPHHFLLEDKELPIILGSYDIIIFAALQVK